MSYCEKALHRTTQHMAGTTAGVAKSAQITKWEYGTDDAAATVETAGYYNSARALLTPGDKIDAVMALTSTPVRKSYVVLTVPASGNVTIGLATTTAG